MVAMSVDFMRTEPIRGFQFAGKKILVTGGSGFIGSHLCRRLCNSGAEVHAISRTRRSGDRGECHWWQGDLAEPHRVQELLKMIEPELIFHLASEVTGARELEFVIPTFRSNLMSTVNVLAAAKVVGCRRIILTGSLEEPTELQSIPCSPYAAAKWSGGAYGRMFHALYELPVVILRLFMVYGPEQQDLKKIIPYVTLSLLKGEAPRIGTGGREVDWVYVEDVVEALLATASANDIDGGTIDIGSGVLVTIRAVVEQLVSLINPRIEPLFGALPDRPLEQVRMADVARSTAMLGWKPTTPLGDGLKQTVGWYERQLKHGIL